ncbi:ATP-binding protein [Pseudomonas sp. TMW22090]|uniref:AAA family ATPase n=1 Tax=Pseudomonas sp. TMW22090 TaxID=2506434 RepID=UPI001F1191E4|nr:AAA family ATPase [Pseudomonas sp. TMW22090]MCH4878514.1 ATP-binding protein [Pseudomonas sp. TMW22090]
MFLKKIEYSEHKGTNMFWSIRGLHLGPINLIVGKNSTGKTRVINVISSLAHSVAARIPAFNSAAWEAEFERYKGEAVESQAYYLSYKSQRVVHEKFTIKNQVVMERYETGEGFVLKKKGAERVRYKVEPQQLMAVVRSDPFQHPQFESLQRWGRGACTYRFGTEFGRGNLTMGNQPPLDASSILDFSLMPEDVSGVFLRTSERFGDALKRSVINDMAEIGYPCEDIALIPMAEINLNGIAALSIAVREKGLDLYVRQGDLSQGMYRALALLIQFNASVIWTQAAMVGRVPKLGDSPMLLIDDIGEGLDHERSRNLIRLLVSKCLQSNIQLIMSTNDRYVMNYVSLKYWTVLTRVGGVVEAINIHNAKEIFEDFSYSGLSNFDFFSGEHYSKGSAV